MEIKNEEYSLFAKRFVHNGITYHRNKDIILVKIQNEKGQYLGLDWVKTENNGFKYTKMYPTDFNGGFIFYLSREIFDEMYLTTVLNDLNKQFKMKKFGKELTAINV